MSYGLMWGVADILSETAVRGAGAMDKFMSALACHYSGLYYSGTSLVVIAVRLHHETSLTPAVRPSGGNKLLCMRRTVDLVFPTSK